MFATQTIKTAKNQSIAPSRFVPLAGGEAAASRRSFLTSEGRGWKNIGAMQSPSCSQETVKAPSLSHHVVMLFLTRAADVRAKMGDCEFAKTVRAGESAILPAGLPSEWRVRAGVGQGENNSGVLQMSLRPEFLERIAGDCKINFTNGILTADLGVADAQTRRVGLMLLEELKQIDFLSSYRADLLAELLAVHLLSVHPPPSANAPKTAYKGGLPPAKLRRVTEFIRENLDGVLSLEDLAGAIEMNAFHFARMFKQATGLPPHRFVVRERIERAKELLTQTKMPLVEISLEVGVQSQSHFTTLLRRHTGRTPKQFRDCYS